MEIQIKKRIPTIVIVGSANVDVFFRTSKLPSSGETVIAQTIKRSCGGKGANQAVAIARLGGKAVMVCRLGSDEYGRDMLENFQREKIETKCIIFDKDSPSGMAFVTVDEAGENTIIVFTGANGRLEQKDIQKVSDVIQSSDACIAQMEIPLPTIEKLAEITHECRVPFILNPAPAPHGDISHIIKSVDILCPNRKEAEILAGEKIQNTEDAFRVGKKLLERGPKNVVITLGAEGAILVMPYTEQHVPAPKVPVCDTTGAGDAFVGALAFAFAAGNSIMNAVEFANIVAAISITKEGTQTALPTLEEVARFHNS